jgi:hypothetical protein
VWGQRLSFRRAPNFFLVGRWATEDLLKNCPTLQEILGLLLKIPVAVLLPSRLVPVAEKIRVTPDDMIVPAAAV